MKKILIPSLFLIISKVLYPQSDCGYYYTYKGRISLSNERTIDSVILRLPKATFLKNPDIQFNTVFHLKQQYSEIPLQPDGYFSKKDTTLGPCNDDPKLYLHQVFIDRKTYYKLIIQIGKIDKVILIDITKIMFTISGTEITIELPEIKI